MGTRADEAVGEAPLAVLVGPESPHHALCRVLVKLLGTVVVTLDVGGSGLAWDALDLVMYDLIHWRCRGGAWHIDSRAAGGSFQD